LQCHGVQKPQPQPAETPTIEEHENFPGSPAKSIVSISSESTQSDSPSPRAIKREHDATDRDNDDVFEVHVAKAQKTSTNTGRPKAADYEDAAKEVILSAANTYRALIATQGAFLLLSSTYWVFIATQGAFPSSSEELELVKRSWKMVNDDSGMSQMGLTPDIVRIVSFSSESISLHSNYY
jgi:hypothetical protein